MRFAWAWGFERCCAVDLGAVILKKKERKKGRKNESVTCKQIKRNLSHPLRLE